MTVNMHQAQSPNLTMEHTAPLAPGSTLKEKRKPDSIELFKRSIERLMSSPQFYRFSVNNILTRWFAKRRTSQVFDLMAGFVNFQVLLTCVKSGLLDRVYESPCTMEELSSYTQLPKENIDRLVLSALSLQLIDQRGSDRFGIGALGLPVVGYNGIKAMIEHNAVLYADMLETSNLLKSKEHSQMHRYWPYTLNDAQDNANFVQQQQASLLKAKQFERYSELMSASQNFVIDEITSSYDFSGHAKMLDIGCGKGRFVQTLAQQYATLEFELMDLPLVMGLTQEHLGQFEFSSRLSFNPGSFKLDPLPSGVDLISLVRIAHDHSDDVVNALLRKIYLTLPSKGTLLLAEPMADPKGARHDAYFHFYLLAMGEGRLRTPEQLSKMMVQAGFDRVKLLANPMPMHTRILLAQKH